MTVDNAENAKGKGSQKQFSLKVLKVVRETQMVHGLRHNDYQLYRQYCTRRLRRMRKNLKLIQGDRKNFKKKEVTLNLLREEKFLYIPLITIERLWAYAMQLKEESLQDSRKKFAMRNKLRKAAKYAVAFKTLVESCPACDARTQLEVQAYAAWLQGTVMFEMAEYNEEWELPVDFFNRAYSIYSKLSSAVSEEEFEIYQHKLQELEVKLRYCRHHLGDKAATDTLLAMRGNEALGGKLDKLVASARESQASTLSELTWKGRSFAVKHEKIRLFLLNEGLIHEELAKTSEPNLRADMLDKLLMECKDAIQLIREDLKNDPSFKTRQSLSEGPVTSMHFLHTYLSYLRLKLTNLRNLALYHSFRAILSNPCKLEEGKKPPKIHDITRLCDIMIQNLVEMTTLAGLEKDPELKETIELQKRLYKGHRCFYVAEHFFKLEKWMEALALYQRTSDLLADTEDHQLDLSLSQSIEILKKEVTSKKYTAHAKVLVLHQKTLAEVPKICDGQEKKMLIDRLDVYVEDSLLLSKSPRVIPVPPDMVSVPCKPLFFDLALNHVDFPSLDDKELKSPSQANQPTGGIRGLVRGLWDWGN